MSDFSVGSVLGVLGETVLGQRIQDLRCILVKTTDLEKSAHIVRLWDNQIGFRTCQIDDHVPKRRSNELRIS